MFRGIYFNQTFSDFLKQIDCFQLLTLLYLPVAIYLNKNYILYNMTLKKFIVPPALLTIFVDTSAIVDIPAIIAEISTIADIYLIANIFTIVKISPQLWRYVAT